MQISSSDKKNIAKRKKKLKSAGRIRNRKPGPIDTKKGRSID